MHVSKILFLFISTALLTNVDAREIKFNFKRVAFKLIQTEEKIEYNDQYTKLSIVNQKCNEHIFNAASTAITQYLGHPLATEGESEFLKIQIDQKIFFENPQTNRAIFFLNLLEFIKSKKIEENLNCTKR